MSPLALVPAFGLIPHFTRWLLVKNVNRQSLMQQIVESCWKPACSLAFHVAGKTLQRALFLPVLPCISSVPCLPATLPWLGEAVEAEGEGSPEGPQAHA